MALTCRRLYGALTGAVQSKARKACWLQAAQQHIWCCGLSLSRTISRTFSAHPSAFSEVHRMVRVPNQPSPTVGSCSSDCYRRDGAVQRTHASHGRRARSNGSDTCDRSTRVHGCHEDTFVEEFIDRPKGRCEESSLEQVRQVSHAVAHHHLIERAVYATTSLRKQRSACRFAEPPKVSEWRSGAVSRCSGGCARSAAADGAAARRYWRAGSTRRSAAALRSRAA